MCKEKRGRKCCDIFRATTWIFFFSFFCISRPTETSAFEVYACMPACILFSYFPPFWKLNENFNLIENIWAKVPFNLVLMHKKRKNCFYGKYGKNTNSKEVLLVVYWKHATDVLLLLFLYDLWDLTCSAAEDVV